MEEPSQEEGFANCDGFVDRTIKFKEPAKVNSGQKKKEKKFEKKKNNNLEITEKIISNDYKSSTLFVCQCRCATRVHSWLSFICHIKNTFSITLDCNVHSFAGGLLATGSSLILTAANLQSAFDTCKTCKKLLSHHKESSMVWCLFIRLCSLVEYNYNVRSKTSLTLVIPPVHSEHDKSRLTCHAA